MDEGYIRIDRKILAWEWYGNINTKVLFFHMLLKANWTEGKFEGSLIPRGSFVSSIKKLALETGLTDNEIRQAIKHLKSTGEITSKSTNKFTVFTIKNYDLYQSDNKQKHKRVTNESQTINKPLTTIEKEKENIINIKKTLSKDNVKENTDPLSRYDFSQEMSEKIREWLKYKAERREGYKDTGLRSLLTQIHNKVASHSEQAVMGLIDECMANGWKGLIWDRLEKKTNAQPIKKNMTNNYEQRDWDFNALEKLKREELRRKMEV